MAPDGLERRLVAAGRQVVDPLPASPRVAAALAEGRRRRTRRLSFATVAGVAGATLLVAVPLAGREARSTDRVSSGPATTAVLIGDQSEATTTTARSASAATTVRPSVGATPTTTVSPPTSTPTPTTAPPTTTAAPRNPEVDGVDAGVWVVGIDGIGLRKVSSEGTFLRWSPTGDRVALAAENWIWKLPTEPGRAATTVASGSDRFPLCMDWASTGDLAWVTPRGDLIDAVDGDAVGRTVASGFGNVTDCRWSPDGSKLLVLRYTSVSIVDRAGKVVRDWPLMAGRWGSYASDAAEWSPDGRRVAVVGSPAANPRNGRTALYVLDADDDSGALPDPVLGAPSGDDEAHAVYHLSWSREERDDLYVQVGRDSGSTQSVIDVVTGSVRELARPGCCQRLDSLADGRFLAFGPTKVNGWRKELLLLAADRTVSRRLAFGTRVEPAAMGTSTCNGSYLTDKRVSPDGSKVAFVVGAGYGPRCDSPVW